MIISALSNCFYIDSFYCFQLFVWNENGPKTLRHNACDKVQIAREREGEGEGEGVVDKDSSTLAAVNRTRLSCLVPLGTVRIHERESLATLHAWAHALLEAQLRVDAADVARNIDHTGDPGAGEDDACSSSLGYLPPLFPHLLGNRFKK
jgi:hypothetical protein